jgi:thiol-disulfide isomerase/thioredoxin
MSWILAVLPLLALAGIQEDFAALKDLAQKMTEERSAENYKALNEATEKFVETYCTGEVSDDAVGVLVKAAAEGGWTGRLLDTYVSHAMEADDLEPFIDVCDRLKEAGLDENGQQRLARPRAIALLSLGLVEDAAQLAADEAEAQGAQGLGMLDVLAAIYATQGKFDDARALYADYKEKYGSDDDRGAYRYESKAKMIGQPAPDIQVATWLGPEGKKVKGWKGLADLRGQTVVLDFWQTWCPPCRAVMPSLSALQGKMAKEPFRIIGVCRDDGRPGWDWAEQASVPAEKIRGANYVPHVQKFMKDMELSYWVGVAPDKKNSENYGVRGIPTLVVIAPDGKVAWITIGSAPGVERLIEILAKNLAQHT